MPSNARNGPQPSPGAPEPAKCVLEPPRGLPGASYDEGYEIQRTAVRRLRKLVKILKSSLGKKAEKAEADRLNLFYAETIGIADRLGAFAERTRLSSNVMKLSSEGAHREPEGSKSAS